MDEVIPDWANDFEARAIGIAGLLVDYELPKLPDSKS